ncbi:MAG: DM13 domain-containing protein [Proteobacteria bacterium]|nr:DM13 domain-containing protein [Pseudomonadota bacterium]
MMKNFLIFVIGGILGVVAGAGGMLIVFPYIFPPPQVNETVDNMVAEDVLLETHFREDSVGQDAGHWGRGGVKIYQARDGGIIVELQEDFEVGPGPNFWLYLNGAADVNNEDDFYADSEKVKLTKLKSFSGSQVYNIDSESYQQAKSLTIWCETFGQYIASANL